MEHVMVSGYSNGRILEAIRGRGYEDRVKVLAQGDSWFAFPLPVVGGARNLVEAISTREPTVAIDLAIVGDTAENMAQGERHAQLRSILAGGAGEEAIPVAAILLSAGGNDLIDRIGDLVGTLTRSARRAAPGRAVARVLEAVSSAEALAIYDDVIDHVRTIIAARDGGPSAGAPVIVHGYAHVTPRDAPALRFPFKVGPWIWKRLAPLGYTQAEQQEIARRVIDTFNARLSGLRDDGHAIHVLDLRPLQEPGGPLPVADPSWLEPTRYWHDEIHLDSAGWDCVASRLYDPLLDALL
ncbi:MAG TPA: hypothetical protein VH301_12885 [Usitatibacter sp.]|jgi:hypothetical protein|nr:hypothetical protein [Usitatibacter sp.]